MEHTEARGVIFSDWQAKAAWLDGAAWMDARTEFVRDLARRIAIAHDPNDLEGIVTDLFDLVRLRVRYVSDPASEEFSDAETVLRAGYGDCDDKVRAFVALCRSASAAIEAHVRPVLQGHNLTHVQALVRWPGSYRHPRARPGGWLVAELILRDARLGDDANDVPNRILS